MLPPALVNLFLREAERTVRQDDWPLREKVSALAGLLERAFFEATRREQIAFSTFFARICYAGQRYRFPAAVMRRIHGFRIQARQVRGGATATEAMVRSGWEALDAALDALGKAENDENAAAEPESGYFTHPEPAKSLRVLALRDVPEQQYFIARDETDPLETLRVRYGLPGRNEQFTTTIHILRKVFGFPALLQLIEVDVDAEGYLIPQAFVIEPDYLMDVSAISECFKDSGADPYAYLVRKFTPHESTEPILLGNIANFFLDRLLTEPQAPWQKIFLETFQLYPFVYAPMSDAQVKSVSGKSQKHFLNIKAMATGGLAQQGINPEHCVLEPAFFSNQYGIQGRLDLLYRQGSRSAIVELKSGSPFLPNGYGISRSHFTQTLLYDLLVRSVFGKSADPLKYILYSGVDVQPLRFAPTIAPEQKEALQVRNQLVALERSLCHIQPGDESAAALQRMRGAKAKGFIARDYERFEKAYAGLSTLERKYFNAFTGFVAREHWLAKVGEENNDNLNGHASLWRGSLEDKIQNFNILSHLEILENHADQPEPYIVFRRTEQTNALANFRVGDIAVLYPAFSSQDTVLQHQVIKCTISRLEEKTVVVQLRFRQHNLKPFDTKGSWRLEPDMIDSSFMAMYRSLLEWAEAGKEMREKILGAGPAIAPTKTAGSLLEKICQSPDFFLLWGPPGTGKTSVMLRDIAAWVLRETDDNLLLLAYTNRAVDEICEALDAIGGNIRNQYIRIGGKYAGAERFAGQLLSSKIAGAGNRAELLETLQRHRVFVSTVASFSQNEGLLKLKKFQRLVVDEASQILEPQLAGLLTRFEHFILIGDHRQLPAVTAQRTENTRVEDADLQSIGITDLRDSYFERLYLLCRKNNRYWSYDRLEKQGRMHEDIMEFPGKWFYENSLRVYDSEGQCAPLHYRLPEDDPALGRVIGRHRVAFFPVSGAAPSAAGQKTSLEEALLCARIAAYFRKLWKENGKKWSADKTLGIITPWRAQIAQIRSVLAAEGIDPDLMTIDTVERYQGGARDVILISTSVQSPWQLASLLNVSSEGVDRKLNVALTRAREHLIMLGNPEVLCQDERYRAFIDIYRQEIV